MTTNPSILSGAISDRGLSEKRPQNEDSYIEMPQSGIYAVADGVGGAQAGEVASQMAVEILSEAFTNLRNSSDAEIVMRTAIERANVAINQMARELPQLSSMATTIVALHLAGNIATIGHVGDSRLYRIDRDGNLHRETDDHSMVAEEVRAGRMTLEQAENHPSRNIISRALGAEPTVDIDLKTLIVGDGTVFLLCSDGVTRHVADQEIKGVLTFGGMPEEICEYLKNLCYERGAEDNLTAVVVKIPMAVRKASQSSSPFADVEEPTVATPRTSFDEPIRDDQQFSSPIETEAQNTDFPELPSDRSDQAVPADDVLQTAPQTQPEYSLREDSDLAAAKPAPVLPSGQPSIFDDTTHEEIEIKRGLSSGAYALAFAMLIVGSLAGLAVYHFALAPRLSEPERPQLSVMRSENVPQSAFEENRRSVDNDPAGYIAKFPDPRDASDFYLLGRAYLLAGDYVKARTALTEARNRLPEADYSNAKVLASDIALAMSVTNNTTIQTMFKNELDANQKTTPANTNLNR